MVIEHKGTNNDKYQSLSQTMGNIGRRGTPSEPPLLAGSGQMRHTNTTRWSWPKPEICLFDGIHPWILPPPRPRIGVTVDLLLCVTLPALLPYSCPCHALSTKYACSFADPCGILVILFASVTIKPSSANSTTCLKCNQFIDSLNSPTGWHH